MYLSHFELREFPFSLTPDTDFFFESAAHRAALNTLHAALRIGEGFIKVTAEIGLGKTLLCRLLLRELDEHYVTAYIPDPLLSPHSLRVALAEELRVSPKLFKTDEQLLRGIQRKLLNSAASGKRAVLLIDEAHQLEFKTLESVRLLTNLETEKAKLLQVVIIGQPELDRRLMEPSLRQLRQRITFDCTLGPLSAEDAGVYIEHRLAKAGARSPFLFSPGAVRAIYRASGGTPRLINMLCHKALLAAYGGGGTTVQTRHAKRAVADSRLAIGTAAGRTRRWWPFGPGRASWRGGRLAAERAS